MSLSLGSAEKSQSVSWCRISLICVGKAKRKGLGRGPHRHIRPICPSSPRLHPVGTTARGLGGCSGGRVPKRPIILSRGGGDTMGPEGPEPAAGLARHRGSPPSAPAPPALLLLLTKPRGLSCLWVSSVCSLFCEVDTGRLALWERFALTGLSGH